MHPRARLAFLLSLILPGRRRTLNSRRIALRALPSACVSYAPVSLQLRAISCRSCMPWQDVMHVHGSASPLIFCGLLWPLSTVPRNMVTACNNSLLSCCSCSSQTRQSFSCVLNPRLRHYTCPQLLDGLQALLPPTNHLVD